MPLAANTTREPMSGLIRFLDRLMAMRRVPRVVVWIVQICIFAFSGLAAFLLRFDFSIPSMYLGYFAWALPTWLIVKIVVFRFCRLDRGWWCFVSVQDVFRIGTGNLLGSLASGIAIFSLAPAGFPRSLYILDFLICSVLTGSIRIFTRIVQESHQSGRDTDGQNAILIYGAGAAGVALLRELRTNPALHYKVIGFVDDNSEKRGIVIQGAKVLGAGSALAALVLKHKIDEVLIALPSATGHEVTKILMRCHQASVRCRTVPALAEVIEGRALSAQIRDVAVEDLLGRNPVRLEESQIRGTIEGKVVLVTGAAGSIGSELCRQIARFHPAAIVGFEIAESPLFEIDREMRQSFPRHAFLPRDRQHPESRSPRRGPAPVLAVSHLSRRRLQARPPDGGARLRGHREQRLRHIQCRRGCGRARGRRLRHDLLR